MTKPYKCKSTFFLFAIITNILLIKLSWSVWENLHLHRCHVFMCTAPHCIRPVLTTFVKILPYRPLAQLIAAKYGPLKMISVHDLDDLTS